MVLVKLALQASNLCLQLAHKVVVTICATFLGAWLAATSLILRTAIPA